VRPPEARRDKPRVSAFTSAKIDRILALQPDLAVGFSDIQADIAQALIKDQFRRSPAIDATQDHRKRPLTVVRVIDLVEQVTVYFQVVYKTLIALLQNMKCFSGRNFILGFFI
jgi:hypothetical protein